ncbi:heme exporter protein CcmB [Moraxella atlantae]|uniref:Heme exporter protein B n=1 Tax=Faucicola atlantae TaxID=34059 RepID=A0A1B8QK04_9GAMM|nr:heme exporter protein CcmB [Moraxella atlantae]OBX83783.1 ABC transporter permease [Moraxella atlantae]OPH36596.1 ABC transporter permease [Moraxella atlantae]STY94383.1 Cytochrome c-type biogenesis protein CcmB [Moraxella atlantae]
MSVGFGTLWRREWQLKQQHTVQWLYPLVLFLLIVTLFPLALGTEVNLLRQLAVPAVWIAALLALLLGTDGLFRAERDNGVLAQLMVARTPLPLWVLARLAVHWLTSAGLVTVLAMLAMPLFGLPAKSTWALMASIVAGSPLLLCLSAIASSLTLSLKSGAVLVPLIALPMQLPVLIFATGAVERVGMGMDGLPILALLLAGSIVAVLVTPWVIGYTLKLSWLS